MTSRNWTKSEVQEIIDCEVTDDRWSTWSGILQGREINHAFFSALKEQCDQERQLRDANQQLSDKDQQLSDTKQQLSDTKQQLRDTKQQLRDKDRILSDRSLKKVKSSFPHMRDTTLSLPHYPKNHKAAELTSATLEAKEGFHYLSTLWDQPFIVQSGQLNCENEAQQNAVQLLNAVLKGMQVDNLIEIAQNRTLAGAECDILLFYTPNKLPFAAIEVKKPGNSPQGRSLVWSGDPAQGGNRVAGETYDELKAIQLFGFASVTGMITTFNHWRIVGLLGQETTEGAAMTHKLDIQAILEKFKNMSKSPICDTTNAAHSPPLEKSIDVPAKEDPNRENERKMWACEIVPPLNTESQGDDIRASVEQAGEAIVKEAVLFVAKAISDLVELFQRDSGASLDSPMIRLREKMPCRTLTNRQKGDDKDKEDVFAFGSIKLNQLNLDSFCETECIHVIHHLGMGDFGSVCLAVSSTGGSCCAIKFFHDRGEREEYATAELANWGKIYGCDELLPKPYTLRAAEGSCLVMPYLHPITTPQQRQEFLKDGTIRDLLRRFAKSGYIHTDIKWRHFRLLKIPSTSSRWCGTTHRQEKIYLIDLGMQTLAKHDNDEKKITEWIDGSIKDLETKNTLEPETKTPYKGTHC